MKPPHRLFAACYQGAMRESADIAWPTTGASKFRSKRLAHGVACAFAADEPQNQDTPRTTGQPTRFEPTTGVVAMTIHLSLGPLVSLIAGILILIMPRLLNFIVAIYLIVIGLIGLFGMSSTHF
jgi:hypothetical protein